MMISTKVWLAYINKLSLIDKTAAAKMQAYVQKHGFDDTQALIDYAYGIATKYGEGSAALAAEIYDAIAELSGKHLPPAEVAPTPEYDEVAKAVNGTAKHRNTELVSNAVGRLVKRTGVDTTMKNAIRDGAEWAWIPHGDTCAFCLTLASRGWQKASKAALKGGHAEHIHAHCDCTYAISFDGKPKYEGYDPDQYLEMYENAEGRSSKDKINALRRELRKDPTRRDKINAQKRGLYALNKEKANIAKTAIAEYNKDMIQEKLDRLGFEASKTFLRNADPKLQTVIADQLEMLENRYKGAARNYSKIIIELKQGEGGSVSVKLASSKSTRLSYGSDFKEWDLQIANRLQDVNDGYCMPCDTDEITLAKYITTHEYGHILQNSLIAEDRRARFGTHSDFCDWYMRDIEKIALSMDPDYTREKYLSEYGLKKVSEGKTGEFFAECFANSQLGQPNVLGRAILKWLEDRGI